MIYFIILIYFIIITIFVIILIYFVIIIIYVIINIIYVVIIQWNVFFSVLQPYLRLLNVVNPEQRLINVSHVLFFLLEQHATWTAQRCIMPLLFYLLRKWNLMLTWDLEKPFWPCKIFEKSL